MTISEWRLRLAELCRDCVEADSDDEGDFLRLAHALLLQAPDRSQDEALPDLEAFLTHLPPTARVEALVDHGAMECVALALLPEEASYLISRSSDGAWLASVFLPGMEEEVSSEGESLAMALTSALLGALAELSRGLVDGDPAAQDAGLPTERAAFERDAGDRESCEWENWVRRGDILLDRRWQRPAGTLLN